MSDRIEEAGRSAAKSAIWYTISTFITKGLGFITIPLFTRIMTTEQFGLFNNFAAWQTILLAIFGLESYATLNRARLDFDEKELRSYQFSLLAVGSILTLLLAIVLLLLPSTFERVTALDIKYLFAMILYLLVYPSFAMFQMLQRVQYRYKLSALLSLSASLVATLLSVSLVVFLPDALMGRIVGQYAPFALLGAVFYVWYWKTGGEVRSKYLAYGLRLSIPLVIAALGSQVLLLGCRIVTQHECGSSEVAYLSLATTVAQIVLLLTTTLNNAWSPWLFDCLKVGAEEKAKSVFHIYMWAMSVLAIVVSLAAPEIVLILGGADYLSTVYLVPSFMFNCVINLYVNQYILLETYYKNVWTGGIATLFIGVINLVLCMLAIRFFGFQAIGYANIASNIILLITHKILVRYIIKQNDIFGILNLMPQVIVGVVGTHLALLTNLYGNLFARYIVVLSIIILLIIILIKRRNYIKILSD